MLFPVSGGCIQWPTVAEIDTLLRLYLRLVCCNDSGDLWLKNVLVFQTQGVYSVVLDKTYQQKKLAEALFYAAAVYV